jgi:AbrB family looped-hinge helix DNA binding protein
MDEQVVVRIGNKGRVVIPAALRERAHVAEGDELVARVMEHGRLMLETRESIKRRLRAQAAEAKANRGGGAVERLLADRRADLELEEERTRSRSARRRTRAEA